MINRITILLFIGLAFWGCENFNTGDYDGYWRGFTSQNKRIMVEVKQNKIRSLSLDYADTLQLLDTANCRNRERWNQGAYPIENSDISNGSFNGDYTSSVRKWHINGTFITQDSASGIIEIRDTSDMCTTGLLDWYTIKD